MFVTARSTYHFAKKESGGKGFNLYRLSQAGLCVPQWIVFGRRYYEDFIAQGGVNSKVVEILNNLQQNRIVTSQAENEIAQLFMGQSHSELMLNNIDNALLELGRWDLVSVRSSAADEDSSSHSFAGQLSSFLYVSGKEEILKYIKKCWCSAFSERSLSYRIENKIALDRISVAVVIQRMIDPQKSGVMFTCEPVEKKLDQFLVSAVYGVGEGLVSGELDADSYWLDAQSGKINRKQVATKMQAMRRGSSGHCELQAIDHDLRESSVLQDSELRDLFHMGKLVQDSFFCPQDIEWAIEDGEIYLLQTRPVTTLNQNLIGYPNLWDNSNIIESYGGITLPLSFSFALRNYKAVYVQFCEVLGVPFRIIREMDSYLSYMLGHLNGRVYYNLFNWYKLVGILPGFKQNREFMETMMGVSESLTDEIANRIKPHPSWETPLGTLRKCNTGLHFLWYHFTIQSMVDKFLLKFHKDYSRFRSLPLKNMRGDQLIQIYMEIEQTMFGQWKAPIINDFLCMVHFGLLRKLTTTWLKGFDDTMQNDLLAGEGGLESAEPTRAMIGLAYEANQNQNLKKMLLDIPAVDLLEALNQSEHQSFYRNVLEYMDRFGFRCMSEMKLEEIDLNSDPSYLFTCLKNYLKQPEVKLPDENHEKSLRTAAEEKVAGHLKGIRKIIYFWVLKHARKAVKNRENTRFTRTRIYGIARTIFQTIGEDLEALGVLTNARDIFWLTIDEVFGIYNGTLSNYDLKSQIENRKTSFASYTEETDPRILTRGAVYWQNSFTRESTILTSNLDGDVDLKGLPCSQGVIEGEVKVIQSPQDNLELSGQILVTTRTDPGWVPLYPSISGLLVERGSLLSHSAIVAREMRIPAIVSIPGLTKILKTGMRVRMDGKAGTVKIISS